MVGVRPGGVGGLRLELELGLLIEEFASIDQRRLLSSLVRSVLALRMPNESARSTAVRIIVYRKNMNKLSNFRRFVTFL